MADLAYNRILLKLSGESLKGDLDYGIDPKALAYLAGEIKEAFKMGVQLSAVVAEETSGGATSGKRAVWIEAPPTTWACWPPF